LGAYSKVLAVNCWRDPAPDTTVRYEWMERLIPRDVTVDRLDRVLVIGTVEDYTTVKHKVWEKKISLCRGTNQLLGWFTRRIVDHQLEEPEWQPYVFEGVHQPLAPPPYSLVAAERLPPRSASFALMDYKVSARAYIKKSIQKGRDHLCPNNVGHIGSKPVYEVDGPLEPMDDFSHTYR
jgi:hypothetical protein